MLNDVLKSRNITIYRAAKEADISYTTLHDIVIEKTDIKKASAETLYRLAKYLDMSMEALYTINDNNIEAIFIHNNGRYIIVETTKGRHQYLGPKNLICFNQINKVQGDVVYVEAVFKDEESGFVIEEEYIDLRDVMDIDRGILDTKYDVQLGHMKKLAKADLVDEAFMVSDNMAILWRFVPGIKFPMIEVRCLSKPEMRIVLKMSNGEIIETNMSERMQKRAIEAVVRNREIINLECGGEYNYA